MRENGNYIFELYKGEPQRVEMKIENSVKLNTNITKTHNNKSQNEMHSKNDNDNEIKTKVKREMIN